MTFRCPLSGSEEGSRFRHRRPIRDGPPTRRDHHARDRRLRALRRRQSPHPIGRSAPPSVAVICPESHADDNGEREQAGHHPANPPQNVTVTFSERSDGMDRGRGSRTRWSAPGIARHRQARIGRPDRRPGSGSGSGSGSGKAWTGTDRSAACRGVEDSAATCERTVQGARQIARCDAVRATDRQTETSPGTSGSSAPKPESPRTSLTPIIYIMLTRTEAGLLRPAAAGRPSGSASSASLGPSCIDATSSRSAAPPPASARILRAPGRAGPRRPGRAGDPITARSSTTRCADRRSPRSRSDDVLWAASCARRTRGTSCRAVRRG